MELAKPVLDLVPDLVHDLNPKLTTRAIRDDENQDGDKNDDEATLVFGRGKRGKSASERAEAARSRDSILAASISYLLPPYQLMLSWIESA